MTIGEIVKELAATLGRPVGVAFSVELTAPQARAPPPPGTQLEIRLGGGGGERLSRGGCRLSRVGRAQLSPRRREPAGRMHRPPACRWRCSSRPAQAPMLSTFVKPLRDRSAEAFREE
jgi:hypothetical protein